jgi:hypothetical protein
MLEDMMKDSEALPGDEKLQKISAFAELAAGLEEHIEATETKLKEYKEKLREIVENHLPNAMAEVGMVKFQLTDGSEINVKPYYSAKIDDEIETLHLIGCSKTATMQSSSKSLTSRLTEGILRRLVYCSSICKITR